MSLVTRCVCFKTTFADWLRIKRANGWTLEQCAAELQCGEGCGLCKPYLAIVEATGQTEIPVMLTEEDFARALRLMPKVGLR